MDTTTLVAALLHDTVEDTGYTLEALTAEFGTRSATWSTASPSWTRSPGRRPRARPSAR